MQVTSRQKARPKRDGHNLKVYFYQLSLVTYLPIKLITEYLLPADDKHHHEGPLQHGGRVIKTKRGAIAKDLTPFPRSLILLQIYSAKIAGFDELELLPTANNLYQSCTQLKLSAVLISPVPSYLA